MSQFHFSSSLTLLRIFGGKKIKWSEYKEKIEKWDFKSDFQQLWLDNSLAALTEASVVWLASLIGNLLGNNMIKSEKSSNKEAIIGNPSHQAPIHL